MKRGILTGIIVRTLLALSGAALVMSSCVNDTLIVCPEGVRLIVKTDFEHEGGETRGPADKEWYTDQIESVTVYAFDENDIFVKSWTGGTYTIGDEYVVPMELEDGNYHFVAWTNLKGDHYSPSHSDEELEGLSRHDLLVLLNIPEDGTLREDIPHRHHGTLEDAEIVNDQDTTHTIVISPHTYKVNFTVHGLPDNPYNMEVTDSNSEHTFGADHSECEGYYHHRRTLASDESAPGIKASMILLQIGDDTGTAFSVVKMPAEEPVTPEYSGPVAEPAEEEHLYTGDLLDTIQSEYDLTDEELAQMLEDVYEYDIILTFTYGEDGALGVDIEVKAWGYKGNHTNL